MSLPAPFTGASTSGRSALHRHHAWRSPAVAAPLRAGPRWAQPPTQGSRRAVAARAASVEEDRAPTPSEEGEEEPAEFVEVGVVGAPHGVRGEMKVQPLTDFPEERLGTPGTRWLRAPIPKIGRRRVPPPTAVELEYGRTTISKGNEAWIVKLEGVESPEEARLLRGHALLIPACERAALEDEDEFYVQDLVGLRVFLASSGEELGKVKDLFDGTGTHDVLRIDLLPTSASAAEGGNGAEAAAAGAKPRQLLLPFVKALVPLVDLGAGRMEIDPPEGLLELATSPAPKQERRENRGRKERRGGRRSKGGGGGDGDGAAGEQPAAAGDSGDFSE